MWDKDAIEGGKERERERERGEGEASAMAVISGMSGGQGGEGAQTHDHIQSTIRESGEGRLDGVDRHPLASYSHPLLRCDNEKTVTTASFERLNW